MRVESLESRVESREKHLSGLALYWRYVGVATRSQMQYPASFWMQAFGMLLSTGAEFMGIVLLFQRFGNLRGWTLPTIALMYGMVNIAFALAEAFGRGFDTFPALIKGGDFDRLLLRPRSTALQVAGQDLQWMRVGRFVQGLLALTWAVRTLGIAWTAAKAGLLLAAILGGACLFYGLFVIQATMAFWTVETLEIMNTVTYGGTETGQYPLTIYRPWFRRFFTFVVPLVCLNYLPANALLDRPDPFGAPAFVQWGAPLVGVVFLLAALQFWKLGVRHYHSTGS